jgi:hypothetical protein
VVKANPKTVAVDTGHMPWPPKCGYFEIRDLRKAAEDVA